MMQYSAVLRQLCLVKSDETLFLVMLLTRPFPLKNPASRTWPASTSRRACVFVAKVCFKKCFQKAACVLVARVCFTSAYGLLEKVLTEGSMRFGGQCLLQKVLTEGSMRFGGQSLLQKDPTFLKFGQDQCSPNACCARPKVRRTHNVRQEDSRKPPLPLRLLHSKSAGSSSGTLKIV